MLVARKLLFRQLPINIYIYTCNTPTDIHTYNICWLKRTIYFIFLSIMVIVSRVKRI